MVCIGEILIPGETQGVSMKNNSMEFDIEDLPVRK